MDWFLWFSCSGLGLLGLWLFHIMVPAARRWSLVVEHADDMIAQRRQRRRRRRIISHPIDSAETSLSVEIPAVTSSSVKSTVLVEDQESELFASSLTDQPPDLLCSKFSYKTDGLPPAVSEKNVPQSIFSVPPLPFDINACVLSRVSPEEHKTNQEIKKIRTQLVPFEKLPPTSIYDPMSFSVTDTDLEKLAKLFPVDLRDQFPVELGVSDVISPLSQIMPSVQHNASQEVVSDPTPSAVLQSISSAPPRSPLVTGRRIEVVCDPTPTAEADDMDPEKEAAPVPLLCSSDVKERD